MLPGLETCSPYGGASTCNLFRVEAGPALIPAMMLIRTTVTTKATPMVRMCLGRRRDRDFGFVMQTAGRIDFERGSIAAGTMTILKKFSFFS